MFTGLIRQLGTIILIELPTLIVKIPSLTSYIHIKDGDSISINGICLTVVSFYEDQYTFYCMEETCNKTTIKNWNKNDYVNIEFASNQPQLDGHIVSGHVDTTAIFHLLNDNTYGFKILNNLNPNYIIEKGSIAIDGVSLTVVDVYHQESGVDRVDTFFTICCIPYTIEHTIIKNYKLNYKVNIEFDLRQKCIIENLVGHNTKDKNLPLLHQLLFSDQQAMQLACNLSEISKSNVSPNPHVGCIITYKNRIISFGYHKKAGFPHAEVEAFNDLFSRTSEEECKKIFQLDNEKCKVYVTLEPCCHFGRTPPCTNLLIKHKEFIGEIIIGILDPDSRISGNGCKILQENQISNRCLNHSLVKESLKQYSKHRSTGMPYVICKIATSLNGKITNRCNEEEKYITSSSALQDVHKTRNQSDCILITNQTYLIDKPRCTVRIDQYNEIYKPVCILDQSKRCNIEECKHHFSYLSSDQLIIWNDDLKSCLNYLAKKGFVTILIECGATLFQSLLTQNDTQDINLIDEFHIYIDSQFLPSTEVGLDFNYKIKHKLVNVDKLDTTIKCVYI